MDTLTVPSLGPVNNTLNTGYRWCRASQYGTPSFHHLCSKYGANMVPSLMVIFPVYNRLQAFEPYLLIVGNESA